jgi:hypothetical protein
MLLRNSTPTPRLTLAPASGCAITWTLAQIWNYNTIESELQDSLQSLRRVFCIACVLGFRRFFVESPATVACLVSPEALDKPPT